MHFLCLHGRGTNNEIFAVQTANLRHELGDHHTFEWVEGSLPCPIDPDLQSTYPGDEYFQYFALENSASYKQALEDVNDLVASNGTFDAVMGFSQGANLAAAVILRQAERDPIEQHKNPGFKCAVFFSGWPPYDLRELDQGKYKEIEGKDAEGVIRIPTAHIYDVQDPRAPPNSSARLRKICSSQNAVTVTHGLGHEIPSSRSKEALKSAVQAIKRTIDQALAAH